MKCFIKLKYWENISRAFKKPAQYFFGVFILLNKQTYLKQLPMLVAAVEIADR